LVCFYSTSLFGPHEEIVYSKVAVEKASDVPNYATELQFVKLGAAQA